jgi:hypothetical protein
MNERSFIVKSAGVRPGFTAMSLKKPDPRADVFSRLRISRCLQGVLRHDRHWLLWREPITERSWRRLRDELADCGNHAENASRVYRCFHPAPALLLRLDQELVYRLSFVVHNFKTPRSSRFV